MTRTTIQTEAEYRQWINQMSSDEFESYVDQLYAATYTLTLHHLTRGVCTEELVQGQIDENHEASTAVYDETGKVKGLRSRRTSRTLRNAMERALDDHRTNRAEDDHEARRRTELLDRRARIASQL